MSFLQFISIHRATGVAVKSESLEKRCENRMYLNVLEIANPFSLSSCCSELAQISILKLFQEG